jgi:NAD(P)-dependent dehydrogenase (short-subunit alcohol dehydrogenase family)
MTLERKVALITGGASGLGREIARELISRGSTIVLADVNTERLEEAKKELGIDLVVNGDVSVEEDVVRVYQAVMDHYGRLDLAINNAGIGVSVPVIETSVEQFEQLVGVNLRGVYLGTREAMKIIGDQQEGTVVNISSGMVRVTGYANLSLYSLSKAGIENFTQCVAREYQEEEGIRLFTVLPGRMKTNLHESMFPGYPEKRLLQPEVIAKQVVDLVEGARSIPTGSSFDLYM